MRYVSEQQANGDVLREATPESMGAELLVVFVYRI